MAFKKLVFCVSALLWFGQTALAEDPPLSCAEIDGQILIGKIFSEFAPQLNIAVMGSPSYSIHLEAGDTLSIDAVEGYPDATVYTGMGTFALPYSFSPKTPDDLYVHGLSAGLVMVANRSSGLTANAIDPILATTIHCSPASAGGGETLQSAGSFVQNGSILAGIAGLRDRNGSGASGNKGSFLAYAGDAATGWRAWAFADYSRYSEAASGSSVMLTMGADHDLGGVRAGLVLSYATTRLDFGPGEESSRALAIGPYLTGTAGPVNFDAFVTFARPDYALLSGDFTGKRTSYGLNAEALVQAGSATLFPYLAVNGASEELDGNQLDSQQLSAGLRVKFATIGQISPYLLFGYESNRQESALSGTTRNDAPRFGFGFDSTLGSGAVIGFDVDAGESIENLRDVGVRLSFTQSF